MLGELRAAIGDLKINTLQLHHFTPLLTPFWCYLILLGAFLITQHSFLKRLD